MHPTNQSCKVFTSQRLKLQSKFDLNENRHPYFLVRVGVACSDYKIKSCVTVFLFLLLLLSAQHLSKYKI